MSEPVHANEIGSTQLLSVVARFWERVDRQPDRPALRTRTGDDWEAISWGDYGHQVTEVALGLLELGIEVGDRVAILASNQAAWHVIDMAILSVGASTVPVYSTSSSSQVAHVLADSGARLCFVDTSAQLAKVLLHREELPRLERIITTVPLSGLDLDAIVVDLTRVRATEGVGDPVAQLELRRTGIAEDSVATVVYTSGTTGPPKGVVLTHGNLAWTISSVETVVGLRSDDRFLSYLPLSHIAERVTSHFGQIISGGETWFARSLATVPEDLRACRPTVFFAVPRVWQKLRSAIVDQVEELPRPIRTLVGSYINASEQHGETPEPRPREGVRRIAQVGLGQTVGRMLRRRLGLDQARFVVSSAAPIHPDLLRWFAGIGIDIAEVWGQTEDCGPATLNPPGAIRIGTVGPPIPGLEVRLGDDGELLVRGGSVCAGYFGLPDATRQLIDPDGWMATGDLGSIDADGYVTITGRKKDLIINAAGKNISPAELETRLAFEPLIGQAVVVGDGQRYLVALLALDADDVATWADQHGTFADLRAVAADPEIRSAIAASVERVNREHAPVEQIKKWRVLPEPLSVDRGELTPTLKVRRPAVTEHYADLIEEMYAESP